MISGAAADAAYQEARLTCIVHHALYQWNIRLTCRACRHARVFEGHQLWWLFHRRRWDDQMKSIGHRFYCGRCCNTDCRKIKTPAWQRTKDPPTGVALAWPDEREWKRAISRYRS
jgi:hypothetical protein